MLSINQYFWTRCSSVLLRYGSKLYWISSMLLVIASHVTQPWNRDTDSLQLDCRLKVILLARKFQFICRSSFRKYTVRAPILVEVLWTLLVLNVLSYVLKSDQFFHIGFYWVQHRLFHSIILSKPFFLFITVYNIEERKW